VFFHVSYVQLISWCHTYLHTDITTYTCTIHTAYQQEFTIIRCTFCVYKSALGTLIFDIYI
jgi:hypothetical protein